MTTKRTTKSWKAKLNTRTTMTMALKKKTIIWMMTPHLTRIISAVLTLVPLNLTEAKLT